MDDATTEYTDLRLKLSAFLRSSRHYTPEQLLSNPAFNVEDMPEERAILLSRIGQHAKALSVTTIVQMATCNANLHGQAKRMSA